MSKQTEYEHGQYVLACEQLGVLLHYKASGPTLLEAVMRLLAKNEWQPMESAPKDGTRMLVTDGDQMEVCEWGQTALVDSPYCIGWRYGCGDDYSCYDEIHNPTHWMALPPMPEHFPQSSD